MTSKLSDVLRCGFCGFPHDREDAELDGENGFWCEACDGYTYLNEHADHHRFTLLLEDKQGKNDTPPEVGIRFNKRLSPLRYPGGKSKFIPFVVEKMRQNHTQTLVSPFTGGGSVELALLHAGVVKKLILNDLDYGVYALFEIIKREPAELMRRIQTANLTHDDFYEARSIIKNGYKGCTLIDAAWTLLIANRLSYSGIYKANPLGGKSGSVQELLARWNPYNLFKRILSIHHMADGFTVSNMDACELIEEAYWSPETTIFIDPPYVAQGKKLYHHYYDSDEHIRLNVLLDSLHQGMPGADIVLCYDNDPLIESLYVYPKVETIGRVYSV